MDVTVRKANSTDAEALKAIDTVVLNDPTRARYIDVWLVEDDVLVADLNGEVVGYGVFNHAFFRQGQADMLMVHSAHRGKGVGEKLLLALESLCDTPKFWVTTNLSNHPMQRLLTRLSYKPCGYIDELDPGDPELIFVKRLSDQNPA